MCGPRKSLAIEVRKQVEESIFLVSVRMKRSIVRCWTKARIAIYFESLMAFVFSVQTFRPEEETGT